MSKNFAITGVSGYIAQRHLKAIKETNNNLIAAVDPHDSAGILDGYFSNVRFFTEFERFDRFVDKVRRHNHEKAIDYLTICSPNHLHDAHARFALREGADVICEKPVVLNPWNIDALQELEVEYGKKINTILQLRVHPSLKELKERLDKDPPKSKKEISLTYITSRGPWYLVSWKGQLEKSGGLASNIGIHFFDMLMWLFGKVEGAEVHLNDPLKTAGYIELENARVKWFLSIDSEDLPEDIVNQGQRTFRSITVDNDEIEFSGGFADLHTVIYKEILAGRGFGLDVARPSIELVHNLREAKVTGLTKNSHPMVK